MVGQGHPRTDREHTFAEVFLEELGNLALRWASTLQTSAYSPLPGGWNLETSWGMDRTAFELERLIGDICICISINDLEGCPLQDELSALCDRL